ncbi:MAG: ribonuclease HIII [Candidatus Cloacimonetes bacterium]|nr:ribonuclease HIII [Candidatus Cloacimonadota bacterium]
MNSFLEYKAEILSKLAKLGFVLKESKIINYGEVLEFTHIDREQPQKTSGTIAKISLYYNKKNEYKFVINKILPENKKEYLIQALIDGENKNSSKNDQQRFDLNCKYAGSDESGKGDYFGPLVVVAFTSEKDDIEKLYRFGVKDSKLLSDERIVLLAEKILLDFHGQYEYFILMPSKYNELYPKFSVNKPGLNEMLAWMHSKVIGNLHQRHDFSQVIIDKFANEKLIKYYVEKVCPVDLKIVTRAENDIVVATASIIARYLYIKRLDELSTQYQIPLMKGASIKVKELRNKIHPDIIPYICKTHFKV